MATREENLKKINDELEQLSDEDLEKVAGGLVPRIHSNETQEDAADLNVGSRKGPGGPRFRSRI